MNQLTRLYRTSAALSVAERRRDAEIYIEALNHTLRGIPSEKVRYHTCYGINEGRRIFDIAAGHRRSDVESQRAGRSGDCGFSSRATFTPEVHPSIVWAKFQAMAEGARLAPLRREQDAGWDMRRGQRR